MTYPVLGDNGVLVNFERGTESWPLSSYLERGLAESEALCHAKVEEAWAVSGNACNVQLSYPHGLYCRNQGTYDLLSGV